MGLKDKKKAQMIHSTLDHLFPHPTIPLKHTSPFTHLIAVLLSARCTDKKVNEITPFLFAQASTPHEMSQLSVPTIQTIIRPCGLSPRKAKAIQELSTILVEKYGGKIPSTFEELEALPGVGHKTASVVMVQTLNKPAFPIDTHIHRLALRWGLSEGKSVRRVEEDLKRLFPKHSWGKLHLQMIYYGRKYCPARGHVVKNCPICQALLS